MNIDVWADIACPFCYIAKRHLENAVKALDINNKVSITWHSFQLDPNAPQTTEKSNNQLLAEKYGRDEDWARQMNENVKNTAAGVGLNFNMEAIVPTNTFNAHRLLHLARTEKMQPEMEEALMSAYFVEGKDTGNSMDLLEIAKKIGMDADRAAEVLESNEFADKVHADIEQAAKYGINAVPFFIINNKYAIAGAQPTQHFIDTLNKIYREESGHK